MSHLWNALCAAYRVLGFESVDKGDTVFRDDEVGLEAAGNSDTIGSLSTKVH